MIRLTAAVLLSTISVALGGCQSIFYDTSFVHGTSRTEANAIDMSDYFIARLAAGRKHLARNRPTQAITAFRQAAYDPARRAVAYNGMAVAYAQLGRRDVAARYFHVAAAADPSDPRFSRNLAKLESATRRELSRQSIALGEHLTATSASGKSRTQLGGGRIRVEIASATLVRLSGKEVRIVHGLTGSNWARSGPPTEVLVRTQLVGGRTARDADAPREIALSDLMARTLLAAPTQVASLQTRR